MVSTNESSWELKIYQLDAGLGDSALLLFLQDSNVKKSILIDGGHGFNSKAIADILQKTGPKICLDAVIITHLDCDHWKGILKILEEQKQFLSKETIFFSQDEKFTTKKNAKDFIKKLSKDGFPLKTHHLEVLGQSIWKFFPEKKAPSGSPDLTFIAMNNFVLKRNGESNITPENPVKPMTGPTETNQASISCLIHFGDFYHLTSGDICKNQEIEIAKYLQANKIELTGMKISHHGSEFSSPEELLLVKCRFYTISHGGFPHHTVLKDVYNSSIQMCYLTNDYDPQNFYAGLTSINSAFTETFLETLQKIELKFLDLKSNLEVIHCCVNNLFLETSTDQDEYAIIKEIQKELEFQGIQKLISNLEEYLDDFCFDISQTVDNFKKIKVDILGEELKGKGNEDLFDVLSKQKDRVASVYSSLETTSGDFDSWLKELQSFKISSQLLATYMDLPNHLDPKIDPQNAIQDPSEEVDDHYEKKKEEILAPLSESLAKIPSEPMIQFAFDFQELVQKLESHLKYLKETSIQKFLVAGTQNTKTRAPTSRVPTPRQIRGDILIQVKEYKQPQTQTMIVMDLNKQEQDRQIVDMYLNENEIIEEDGPLKEIRKMWNNPNKKDRREESRKEIQLYQNIFAKELLEKTFPAVKEFTVVFKKGFSESRETISIKLKTQSRVLKLKYLISKSSTDANGIKKWAIRRQTVSVN